MRPELPALESVRHVHLVAVCGTGMGTLACMLADRGFRVTGSDLDAYPPMSHQLEAARIEILKGFVPDHIEHERPDLVVIGNAVRRDNPEALAVIDAGIPYLSFPDAVHDFFIRGKHSVVVTGTHGKTTCTSLIGWILTRVGLDPSVLIGGVASNFGGSFRLGEGDHFVIEGDEYDTAYFDKTPKFLHYDPRTVLLTSCEFDHADIYDSLDQIQAAFRQLAESLPPDGRIVAATDAESVRAIVAGIDCPVEGYGFREPAYWRVSDVTFDAKGTSFNLWRESERLARVKIPLFGRHNVENALGAIAICSDLGVDAQKAGDALTEFEGVRRRQEEHSDEDGFAIIDDFAHHPTAVRETIAAIRTRYPERRLVAVFEPRTNTSRRRFFEDDYIEALSGADTVVLAGVFRAEQIDEAERMRPERVVEALVEGGTEAISLPGVDEIVEHLARTRSARDVVLIMSNGGFGGIWDRLRARVRNAAS